MKISEIDANGRWTGRTLEVEEAEGCPRGWRLIDPPTLGEGEFAEWTPDGWRITSEPVPPTPGPTLAELKALASSATQARCDALLTGGYKPSSGPLAGQTLQLRNNLDRTNWLTSQAAYGAAVAAGAGAVSGATFRTAENITTVMTYAEGLGVLLDMAAWGASVYAACWAIKDAIAASADDAALDAVDLEAGWPA